MPVTGRVFESPAAAGEATPDASELAEPLELELAAPPPPPPPPPLPLPVALSTRIVPCMFG
jgi:hypothetical protein